MARSATTAMYNIDERLLHAVVRGNQRDALKMLTAFGASVDGSSQQDYRPLSWAAVHNHVGMINFLVGQGADLEAKTGALPSTEASIVPYLYGDYSSTESQGGKTEQTMTAARGGSTKGMTAVHVAIYYGQVKALRALLRAGADPNNRCTSMDVHGIKSQGITPLFAACNTRSWAVSDKPKPCVALAHELLEAGADPSVMENSRLLPLHLAAGDGNTGLIDLLLEKAPGTLNHGCEEGGSTPLSYAVSRGHECAVLHLLSAGAQESKPRLANKPGGDLLVNALLTGDEKIIRLLLKQGLWALGGAPAVIPSALSYAVKVSSITGDMTFVRLLLEVEGAEREGHWARCSHEGLPMIHHAASKVAVAAAGVLLQAGADETALGTSCGRTAMECVGTAPGVAHPKYAYSLEVDPAQAAAVRRTLGRGPAYRARSWGWRAGQVGMITAASPDGPAGAAGAAGAARTVRLSSSRPTAAVGVRIFRPENAKFYVRLISRYSSKS